MQTSKDYSFAGKKGTVTENGFVVIESELAIKANTHLMNATDFFEQGQVERELLAVQDPRDHNEHEMLICKRKELQYILFPYLTSDLH